MKLDEIFRGSTYKSSVFSPEAVSYLEDSIYTKNSRGVDVPCVKCIIRDKEIRLTPEETVRQLYIYDLIHSKGYSRENIRLEHAINFGREVKRADIVIFERDHPDSEYIIIEVKKPKLLEGKGQLKSYCNATGALIGVWTNGELISCYHRKEPNYFELIPDIPNANQKLRDILIERWYIQNLIDKDKLNGEKRSLKALIQEMEDEVLANAGVDAFEEVFKLIYTKLYDEMQSSRDTTRALEFRNYGDTDDDLKANIQSLFDKAKSRWPGVFAQNEKIALTPSHLAVCVSSLQDVKLFNSNLDVIDDAFEYLMNKSSKGEKGQFFTPRYVIDMCVKMLNPDKSESMIDTAAGSCGFPVHTMFYVWKKINEEKGITQSHMFTAEKKAPECEDYVRDKVFAIDFDEKAVRVARTLNLIAGDGHTNVIHLNTLDYSHWKAVTQSISWLRIYSEGWLRLLDFAESEDSFKNFAFDIVMANPPFAGDIQQREIISQYELGKDSKGKYQSKVGRDILFIERNLQFLKPGGRMAIILPQGRFNNSSDKYIRDFISERCRILAVVGLHVNVFKPHTGTKTSVLLVQKWDDELCPRRDDYPIFFATMQKPGKDNSGDKVYVKDKDSFLTDNHGHFIVDHDLFNHEGLTHDGIAEAFIEFAKREQLSFFVKARPFEAFNQEKYKALMDGLECCEVMLSRVFSSGRLDSEYYSKRNIYLQEKLNTIGTKTIADYGGRLDCSAFYPSVADYYSNDRSNVPFLRVNEINNGLINITEATVFLPERILRENSKTMAIAYPGDIVIAKGGTVAKVGLVTEEFPMCATSRDVIILRTDKLQGLNKYYLWAFLHSSYGRGILLRSASQTIQPHLTLPAILAVKVPDITGIQQQIEKLYKESVNAKRKAEALYTQAQHLLPFRMTQDSGNQAIKSFSEVFEAGRLDAEYFMPKYYELFTLLETFSTKRLGELVSITKSIEPGSECYGSEGVPFIRVSDVSKMGISQPSIMIPANIVPDIERLYPKKDTILLSKDGSIGIAYKVREDMQAVTSGALLHLRVRDVNEVLPDYLALVLNSQVVQLQAERASNGAVIKHWRPEDIAKVVVPLPDYDTQNEIAGKIQESFTLRRKSEELINLAVKSVELAIESSESDAMQYINNNMKE